MIKISFKKKSWHLFVMLFAVLLYGMYTFYGDVAFYFHSGSPKELGDAMNPNKAVLESLQDGDFVKVEGIRAVQGGTLKKGFWGDTYTLFYLTGSNRFIAIQQTEKDEKLMPAYVTLEGRIYAFKTNGYAQKMELFFKNQLFIEMSPEGFLIHSGVKPGDNLTSVLIFALLVLLFLINIGIMVKQRWFPYVEQDEDEFI